jgi:thiamine pyrophosphokinase
MKTIRFIILTNGYPPSKELCQQVIKSSDFIIAADGGAKIALKYDLKLNLAIGDFDSLNPKTLKTLEALGVQTLKFPKEKDQSDLELALDYALKHKAKEIIILGALGKRPDHFLTNIMLLIKAHTAGVKAFIRSENWEIFIPPKQSVLSAKPGAYLSLIPLTPAIKGLTLQGFKYPLKEAEISWGSSQGLSNRFLKSRANLSYNKGILLIVKEVT